MNALKRNLIFIVLFLVITGGVVVNNLQNNKSSALAADAAANTQGISTAELAKLKLSGTAANKLRKAPEINLKGLDDRNYQIGGKHDKPIMVTFWASWCEACDMEAPQLVKLSEKYAGQLEMYGVNATSQDSKANAKLFAEKHKLPFPILLDNEERTAFDYQIENLPTSFLIDTAGNIVDSFLYIPQDQMEMKIHALLKLNTFGGTGQ